MPAVCDLCTEINLVRFNLGSKAAFESDWLLHETFFSLWLDLPNWGSVASNFVKALTNTFMIFSFAFVNIR